MRRMAFLVAVGATALAACTPIEVNTPFSASEVAYVRHHGRATVTGQAFLRQMGGGVVTCAGSGVVLIPAGGYATELFTKAFGNREGGLAGALTAGPRETPAGFEDYTRKSQCDAGGNFVFTGVPNGDYYVIAKVQWYATSTIIPEGGVVGRRISVRGGAPVSVIVTA